MPGKASKMPKVMIKTSTMGQTPLKMLDSKYSVNP